MNIYLVIILIILIGEYFFNLTVEILNLKHLKTTLPNEFNGLYDSDKYKKSQEYLKETTRFGLFTDTLMTFLTITFILAGGFNIIDRISRDFGFGEIITGLIFVAMIMLFMQIINLPLSAYSTFTIEEKYDFNKTTVKTFILDILKGWLLAAVLGGILFSVILWFFGKTGEFAWLYCWTAVTVFQIFVMFIAPVVIMPLFNKFTPIEECELKTTLDDYADKENFKMKGVFTMDGSKRSTKSNAFFTGFGKFRRIVLFDTLIEKHSTDELVSILAHEIGHYKKKHILTHLLTSITTNGIMFYILSFFLDNPGLFEAFKMDNISIYAGLLFFGFLYTPIEMIISIFSSIISRKNEYQADEYSVRTYNKPEAMILALKKLSVDNLSNLTPHPLKVFLSYSHPPVLERIKAIRELAK